MTNESLIEAHSKADKTSEISCGGNTHQPVDNEEFLANGSGSPKEDFQSKGNPPEGKEIIRANEEVLNDIATKTATELRKTYPLEYKRWDNMKQRKKKGAIIDSRFEPFNGFLKHMGKCPNTDYTLDRIDNDNQTYSPENCRWADKYTQNSNKGNNVYLTHEGETHTIAQWAAIKQQNPSTLYKRRVAGWTDEEIITGVREQPVSDPWEGFPWPLDKREAWERRYQKFIFGGGEESRLEFLTRVSKNKLTEANTKFMDTRHSDSPYGDAPSIASELKAEAERWQRIHANAKNQLAYEVRRKAFIKRKGSYGHHREAVIFDMMNKRPLTLEEQE